MFKRAPQRRRNRARPRAHLRHAAVRIVSHDDAARIAGEPLSRLYGNARAVFDNRLAGPIRQNRRVDVDDNLQVFGRRAGVQSVVKRRLGQEPKRIGLLLLERRRLWGHVASRHVRDPNSRPGVLNCRRFRGNVFRGHVRGSRRCTWPQGLPRRCQCLHEKRADLGFQPATHDDHTVVVLIHMERPTAVALLRIACFFSPIDPAPAAHNAFDVLGRSCLADDQEPLLSFRRRDAGQRADLGVRELAARECLRQPRQAAEGAGHADALARGGRVEPDPP